jgi:hypothetical protein
MIAPPAITREPPRTIGGDTVTILDVERLRRHMH